MLQLFQEFVTPQQKKLAAIVKAAGGDAARRDEQTMERLFREESALTTARPGPEGQRNGSRSFDFGELQAEIKEDPNNAIEKNAEFFDRKFEIQRRQIVEDIAHAIAHTIKQEGNRIIHEMEKGPHIRIFDLASYLSLWNPMTFRSRTIPRTFGISGRKW